MRQKYKAGGYGYGHAKKELLELILERFSSERSAFDHYMNNLDQIDQALAIGAEKATLVADEVLGRVRAKLGY